MRWRTILEDPSKAASLTASEARTLIDETIPILLSEGPLVDLSGSRVLVVGDLHGDLSSAIWVIRFFLKERPDLVVFLGDYVDRGYEQTGTMNALLALKVTYPDRVVLLRGNHETPLANRYYGFLEAVYSRYPPSIYTEYSKLFSELPFVAVINSEAIALHGGIPKPIPSLRELRELRKGLVNIDENHPAEFQLLWNDPEEFLKGFHPSYRGEGIYLFGRDVFEEFMEKCEAKFMIRAHQVFSEGYKYFFGKKLLSVFSARRYGFRIEAKVALLDWKEGLRVSLIPVRE